jgi:aryl-alcohol dehydrogenase-like predicted oxidoreductase
MRVHVHPSCREDQAIETCLNSVFRSFKQREMHMLYRDFGKTGLKVSALGYGAGMLGSNYFSDVEAGTFLNSIIDLGITLIDTARSYGLSEERIGKHLRHRRQEFILATKVGYGIQGFTDWTYDCVCAGIDEALQRLRTDIIDIVFLHSCPRTILEEGGPLRALEEAKRSGKIRVIGYSGENEELNWALSSGRFGCVEHSLNICDQRVLNTIVPHSMADGMGVIAKRPLANAPWRYSKCPQGEYVEEYWRRWKTMNLDTRGLEWKELALRFVSFAQGISSCIVGTTHLGHVKENIANLEKGPLAEDHVNILRQSFRTHDPGWWIGQI